jgi:hypothetical protein
MDLGSFGNGLTSQTVVCDSQGVAKVDFLGVAGTIGDTNIVCASPVCSGQIKFIISTFLPKSREE